MNKTGNVRREQKASVEEIPQFTQGDVISLTAAAIRRSGISNMTPRVLYEIGHPNEFVVFDAFDDPVEGPCVSLLPCCTIYEDRKTGKKRCTGHPAVHFEKKSTKRLPKKGDKSSSIHLPFMQVALAGINWEEDESNPALKAHVLGKELTLTGPWAKMLKQLAEDNNVL
jgi:hypothetical protein